MRLVLNSIIIAIIPLFIWFCKNDSDVKKSNLTQDMKKFEQETQKEIMSRKIDIMQMKQDIRKMGDPEKSALMKDVENIESKYLKAESNFKELKEMNYSLWPDYTPQLDSTIQYLGAKIDSIKLNITVITNKMNEDKG